MLDRHASYMHSVVQTGCLEPPSYPSSPMLLFRPSTLVAALLLLAAPALSAQTLTVTDVSSPVMAGGEVTLSFTLENGPEVVDGIVAVVTDPSGRALTSRNLHAGDVAAGATFSKTVSRPIPENALSGTYSVEVQARTADRTVVASAPTSFVVLSARMPEPTTGFVISVPRISPSVSAGDSVSLDVDLTNNSGRTVDAVFAVVVDPSGRTLTARPLYAGTIEPGETLQKTITRPIPPNALRGTYQVQIQARSVEGDILASQPTSFVVTD